MEAVLLANGSFPSHPLPRQCLREASFLVCTDGAVAQFETLPLGEAVTPTWIVGDMDSIPPRLRERYAHCLVHNADQETNDLTKAVTFCRQKGVTRLTILGATGKREDHTLGNISLLCEYVSWFERIEMVTNYGVFRPLEGPATLPCAVGSPISFFSFNPLMRLTAKGVKYPVEHVVFSSLWKATLNVCTAPCVEVNFTNGPLLVYQPFSDIN